MSTITEPNSATGEIVVGIDGSDSSRDALRWAAAQAALTGKPLHAMFAWEEPMAYVAAKAELEKILGEVLGDKSSSVRSSVHNGAAGFQLVRLSETADLVVVGSRGHNALAGALLGSVSEECVHHASCPVVVVRHEKG